MTARPVLSDYDFENVLISAVRYAVGRGSEPKLGTARIVAELAPWLTGRARSVIARDVATEMGYGIESALMPDHEAWQVVLDALTVPETGDPA